RHFLCSWNGQKGKGAYLGAIDSDKLQFLFPVSSRVEYAFPGYVLYVREGSLIAQPFDAKNLKLSGDPFVVLQGIQYFEPLGWAEFSASANGVLAYYASTYISRIVWLDRQGHELGQLGPNDAYQTPRISPDGQKVALNVLDPQNETGDLWIHELS